MNRLLDFVMKFRPLSHRQRTTSDAASNKPPPIYKCFNRDEPCDLLLDAGIPCKIWGPDVFAYHGLPTFVVDLFLFVHDAEEAALVLEAQDYLRTRQAVALLIFRN